MKAHAKKALAFVCGAAALALLAVTVSVTASRTASASAQFAASTGKACGFCHVNPAGGGALKAAGKKFKANGNKL